MQSVMEPERAGTCRGERTGARETVDEEILTKKTKGKLSKKNWPDHRPMIWGPCLN